MAIHAGFEHSRNGTPTLALADEGERGAPTFACRRLVFGRNSWESSSIQAPREARPRNRSWKTQREFGAGHAQQYSQAGRFEAKLR
jgi:hypothetical protein